MVKYLIKIILFSALMTSISFSQMNPILQFKIHDDVIDTIVIRNEDIYTGSYDGYVKKTSIKTGETSDVYKQNDWIRAIVIVGNELIVAGNEGSIIGINMQSQKKMWKIDAHKWWITGLAYESGKLITVSMDEHVKVWDIVTKNKLFDRRVYGSHKHQCLSIGDKIALIGSTTTATHLSFDKEFITKEVHQFLQEITILACSNKNDDILGLSDGKVLKLGTVSVQKNLHNAAIKSLVEGEKYIYTASDDGKIIQSDNSTLENNIVLYNGNIGVSALVLKNNLLYAGFADGTMKIFDIKGSF